MTDPDLDRRSAAAEVVVEMGRMQGLSDGVVAFALTVLVLDIRIPPGLDTGNLAANLASLGPELSVYLISFAIIGGAWGSQQRMHGQLRRGDGLLVWFTMLSLLPITLLPACAALLADYPDELVAVAVFAADVIAIQLTSFWLWRHAGREGLISSSLDPLIVAGIGRRLVLNALAFGVSIPLALISPAIAYAVWVLVFALVFTTDWLSWQQSVRTTNAVIELEGATEGRVHILHAYGRLHVDGRESDGALLEGVFGGGLKHKVTRADGRIDVELSPSRRGGLLSPTYPWAWGRSSSLDWDVGLTGQTPIAMTIEDLASTLTLELAKVRLTDLLLRSHASAVSIELPADAGHTIVRIEANASSVKIAVPDGVAAWIHSEQPVASFDVDTAHFPIVRHGSGYQSVGYQEARNRVDISAELRSGSLTVMPARQPG